MWPRFDTAFIVLLLVVHVGLLLWGLAGLAEFLLPAVPWPSLENPLFPWEIQLAQWLAILLGALMFLGGFDLRWRLLPWAMIGSYLVMAAVCAVETFTLLQHDSRFLEMALEYLAYLVIVAYLFRSPATQRRIRPSVAP